MCLYPCVTVLIYISVVPVLLSFTVVYNMIHMWYGAFGVFSLSSNNGIIFVVTWTHSSCLFIAKKYFIVHIVYSCLSSYQLLTFRISLLSIFISKIIWLIRGHISRLHHAPLECECLYAQVHENRASLDCYSCVFTYKMF